MRAGRAFLPNSKFGDHLWIVIYSRNGQMVMVNFTSHVDGCDDACTIEAGEHEYVSHKTVVAYGLARLIVGNHIDRIEKAGIRKEYPPVSDVLLEKIRRGAIASRFTPNKIKRLLVLV